MKRKIQRKLELSRETLRSLGETGLREAVGGAVTRPPLCGSDANTACFATCLCDSTLC